MVYKCNVNILQRGDYQKHDGSHSCLLFLEENSVSPEECLGCKNSTLLDTSKAINIEKMPQLANLSKIDGNVVYNLNLYVTLPFSHFTLQW